MIKICTEIIVIVRMSGIQKVFHSFFPKKRTGCRVIESYFFSYIVEKSMDGLC